MQVNAGNSLSKAKTIFLFFIFCAVSFGDITVVSWNLRHLGRKDQDLKRVAYILPRTDLIMIQEVNVSESGAEALAALTAELSRLSARRYCMAFSERPTDARERYAMLWKEDTLGYVATGGQVLTRCPTIPVTLRLGDRFAEKILREPAFGVFQEKASGRQFLAATVHVVPKGRADKVKPQDEIPFVFETAEFVADDPARRVDAIILGGDFNLSSGHEAFDAAKSRGFRSVLSKTDKTSLKRDTAGYSQAFDGIYIRRMRLLRGAVAPVFKQFPDLSSQEIFNRISDHAPIKAVLDFMN